MISLERANKFIEILSKNKEFEIKYKNESLLMRFVGFLLFFNKSFMYDFITTIGNVIYFPSKESAENNLENYMITIAHEFTHMKDNQKMGNIYIFYYLFPQILVLLSFLSIFAFLNINFLFFLFFIIFALPFPAYGRKNIEVKGYKSTLYTKYLILKELGFNDIDIVKNLLNSARYYNKHFKNSSYYFMWPFGVEDELMDFVNLIMSKDVSKDITVDNDIYKLIKYAFDHSAK